MDCNKLRSNNYVEFIREVYDRSEGGYVNDELILNLYDQSFELLSPRYNCMTHKPFETKDPVIVHFSGKDFKPWLHHVYERGYYLKYYKLWEYFYLTLAD